MCQHYRSIDISNCYTILTHTSKHLLQTPNCYMTAGYIITVDINSVLQVHKINITNHLQGVATPIHFNVELTILENLDT